MIPAQDVIVVDVGPISLRWHRAKETAEPQPTLLWIHGGGYLMGSARQDDAICRQLAAEAGVSVAAVEYRLAPEHRFPVPLHDCYDALAWVARQPGVDEGRLAVGGASAGGGLAAALALLVRERGELQLAHQLLAYPMLDDRTALRGDVDNSRLRLWNNESNRFGWHSYTGLPPGSSDVGALAAPGRCEDLSGLPPAWIGVGTMDLFYEEDVDYAHRLRAAGVDCELMVVDGAFHGFDAVRPKAGVSRQFRSSQVKALQAALG